MATRKQNPATPDPAQVLLQEIAAQDSARRLHHYIILGRAYTITTPKGVIKFSKQNSPGVAQETVNGEPGPRLLLVSNWPELPDQKEYSEQVCTACLAPCGACSGEGKAGCIFMGCGGTGKVKTGEMPCPDCVAKVGHFELTCKTCGGYGAVNVLSDCPACKGTKVTDCSACRGIGKRPTGFAGGSAEGALCSKCRGSMRAGTWKKQEIARFVMGKLGNYIVIGPVVSITVEPEASGDRFGSRFGSRFEKEDPADGAPAQLISLAIPPDEYGTPLLVLFPDANGMMAIPGPAYFFGGAKFA